VMNDSRLPTVHWSLTLRQGSHSDPAGQEGLASLSDAMLSRGAANLSYAELSKDLDSRGITINITDGGDYTRLEGSCTTDQLDHALVRTRQILLQPTFSADEFAKLKEQTINGLLQTQESPTTVAMQELSTALYGTGPLGRHATPASVGAITVDQVKDCYARLYQPGAAIFVFSGDVTIDHGKELATALLDGWKMGTPIPLADYALGAATAAQVILVDRPEGAQATVRMGVRAYDIRDEEKFAGSVAGQILSSGIDSRLGQYVRAEKGLAYAVQGLFQPNRHTGMFIAATDTDVKLAPDAITAMMKVLNDMCAADVTPAELADAQRRTAGSMVMGMQTIGQQAGYRVDGILNDYPIDYYDKYAGKIAGVTTAQVRDVMSKYVKTGQFVIVVVGPAAKLKGPLAQFGKVEVIPMPAKRIGATTQRGDGEMLH
jgi:zinc protease